MIQEPTPLFSTKAMAAIALDVTDSYFHFDAIRQSDTGVVR